MTDNRRGFCLEYSTAPTARDPANHGQMLPIQLQLGELYDRAKVYRDLKKAQIRGDDRGDFHQWWPQHLRDESPEWILWHVRILPQQLQLLFSRRNPVVKPLNADPFSGMENANVAQVTITAPVGLVCDFVVPPVLDEQPERCVHYDLVRYDEVLSDSPQWYHLRVVETVDNVVQFRYNLKTPFLGKSDPESGAACN